MDHHDGNGRGRLPRGYRRCSRYRNDYVDRERDEFSCQRGQPFQLAFGLTLLNYDGLAVDIASLRQASHYTVKRPVVHAKQANARELSLLRARRRGPPRRRAEPRDELPSPHSITSSARARSAGEIVMLSASAVFRLITNSNREG